MELQSLKQRFGIIGNSPGLNNALSVAMRVAPTNLSVLILGESGVGKDVFSQIIHQLSPRKHNSFIAVNCGAIPEGTIDSELFGHEKGAFTGASDTRKGYFEVVNGGTIFLDEIGDMPLGTQARLLRVLESGEFIKVGSSKSQRTDVRIIAATNVNLAGAVGKGKFREDLYYRLSTVPITIPPLRERQDDTYLLFRKFVADFADRHHIAPIRLTEDAQHLLLNYRWPGNIRELKNVAEQVSVLSTSRSVNAEEFIKFLPQGLHGVSRPPILSGVNGGGATGNEHFSEREILYKFLVDMRRDIHDLKQIILQVFGGQNFPTNTRALSNPRSSSTSDFSPTASTMPVARNNPSTVLPYSNPTLSDANGHNRIIVRSPESNIGTGSPHTNGYNHGHSHNEDDFKQAEIVEESLSLADMEKEYIQKALDKHKGKRKDAALELGISERTLYRKIKEYGIKN